ncbi:MAG TPA: YceH family protein, partial [Pyrinomonadaceae bacterium]|nr:YceH family protein [Pyrinomonadaceae bacterium]
VGRAALRGATTLEEELTLSAEEVRVTGALIEKQVTTPEYYPLTLNALVNACNQINNRDPVVAYDEATVSRALERLRDKRLAREVRTADGRVPKYRQVFEEVFGLSRAELAVMCVLMLRGPQTVGELRGRTERLYPFSDISFVEATLEGLSERTEKRGPLVVRLPRQAGRKESRYAHLLSGAVEFDAAADAAVAENPRRAARASDDGRVGRLEEELAAVRREVEELRREFAEFRRQFE